MSSVLCVKSAHTHIGRITIAHPEKANSFTLDMVRALRAALDDLESDDAIKVVVIDSQGNDLSVGIDVSDALAMYRRPEADPARIPSQRARLAAHHELWWGPDGLFQRLLHCRKITVVAAQGRCFGVGMYLALCSDLVIGTSDAKFAMPRWRHVGVDSDISMLVAAVGLKRAKELMYCDAHWSAQEAYDYGLIDQVVAPNELAAAVGELAGNCAMIMRDGIAAEKQIVFAALAKMQFDMGFAASSVVGGWASNIHHREGEFNFLREMKAYGAKDAMRLSQQHFAQDV